ncbi:MAG: hypothetical protein Q4C47_04590, partial [Planctomycetia bacterium]|nr:hypothetical protein [Planctomycetia bacterium]
MKKFEMICFGCKVNQYETELMRQTILKHVAGSREVFSRWPGAENTSGPEPGSDGDGGDGTKESPDLVVIHTCTVTAESDSKCRRAIRHFARAFPEATIAVCGCYVRRDPLFFTKDRFPEVDVVLDSDDAIVKFLASLADPQESVPRSGCAPIQTTLRTGLDVFP